MAAQPLLQKLLRPLWRSWVVCLLPVAVVIGSLVALFLWLLDKVTQYRWQHEWLLYLLPLAGVVLHYLYVFAGKKADKGNNLIIEEVHMPNSGVPGRMAPLVLIATLITHLFGGSAGREGTAVQLGGSIAGFAAKWMRISAADTSALLICGMAAGFGAVFGTPLAGAVFAVEVLSVGGKWRYGALLPCIISAYVGDAVCTGWGIGHTHYTIHFEPSLAQWTDSRLWGVVALTGLLSGIVARLFTMAMHSIKHLTNHLTHKWLMPLLGGVLVIGLVYVLGTDVYLGLGVTPQHAGGISIINAFLPGGVATWSWLWKGVFTLITLVSGYKGGEVTPLFFIGACLGNSVAAATGSPTDLLAGLGFIAVFAGAANTPIASILMGIALFGPANLPYYIIACYAAYYCSGHKGMYTTQLVVRRKGWWLRR